MDPDIWVHLSIVGGVFETTSLGGVALDIFGTLFLMFVFSVFAYGETALYFGDISEIKSLEQQEHKVGSKAVKICENKEKYIVTFKWGRICCALVSFTLWLNLLLPVTVNIPLWQSVSLSIRETVSYVVLLFIFVLTATLFGHILPYKKTVSEPEQMLIKMSSVIYFFGRLFMPISVFIIFLENAMNKTFRLSSGQKQSDTDLNEEKDVIEEAQQDMINRIFEFDETTAEEMMTHRTDIVGLDMESSITEAVSLAMEHGYSRIPVYQDDIDNIIGVLYMKDLFEYIDVSKTDVKAVSECMRPALYVPENNCAREIFGEFTDTKVQMAVVVDEYGGTSGIITMEDLLEGIVGNIQDEYDNEAEDIEQTDEKTFLIQGTADIDEVAEKLGVPLPDDSDHYGTIAGLITDILGRIPEENECPDIEVSGVRFTVLEMSDRRIGRVKAEIMQNEEELS